MVASEIRARTMPPGPCRRTTKYSRESTTTTNGGGHPSAPGSPSARSRTGSSSPASSASSWTCHLSPARLTRTAKFARSAPVIACAGRSARRRAAAAPSPTGGRARGGGQQPPPPPGGGSEGGGELGDGAIVVTLRVEHPAAAQRVVQQDDGVVGQPRMEFLDVAGVPGLVRVDEGEIEGGLGRQRPQRVQGRAQAQLDAVFEARPLPVAAGDRRPLLLGFEGGERAG